MMTQLKVTSAHMHYVAMSTSAKDGGNSSLSDRFTPGKEAPVPTA
jgi:hypothetical protein